MRDNDWLKTRLEQVWRRYFPDIDQRNRVYIRFGRKAKTRLGSIKFIRQGLNSETLVTVTGLFKDPEIPDFVVDGVIAHELSHYAHGFFSPHKRLFRHPHQHGVVNKELTNRGLGDTLTLQKRWLKRYWLGYLKAQK